MATELARMRQIIGTTADWAANDIVILQGEIALELRLDGFVWGKVGDGINTYSTLEYAIGGYVDLATDQSIGGLKKFEDAILIENQSDPTKYGQLYSDNFPALVHALSLDSREVSSNVYIQARDAAGLAQTLTCGADGKLYWNSKVIADDTGVYGVTWGRFDGTGTVTGGTGFSVSRFAEGQYIITFDQPAITATDQNLVAMIGTLGNIDVSVTGFIQDVDTIAIYTTAAGDIAADAAVSFTRHYNAPGTFS